MKEESYLTQDQLELLSDPKMFALLAVFDEPKSASDAARILKLPANTVHFRVKKLLALNLIIELEGKNKPRLLQAVAEQFLIPTDLLPSMPSLMPLLFDKMMDELKNQLLSSLKHQLNTNLADAANDKPGFSLKNVHKKKVQTYSYPAELRLSTFKLSSATYLAMQQELIALLDKYQALSHENSSFRDCSVNLICFAV